MRNSRTHTEYLFRVDCEKLLKSSTCPILATFTFAENITNHSEASARWLPVARYLRARGVRGIGVWQRQKRGAWHLHMVLSKWLEVAPLRERAVESGWGQFVNLRLIRAPEADRRDWTFSLNGRGSWSVVGYLARYLTRDFQKDFGAQLVVRVGAGMRCGNVRFAWVDGASYVWRVGCGVAFGEGFVRLYSQAWQYRDEIFAWGRQQIFEDLCAWFESVSKPVGLASAFG